MAFGRAYSFDNGSVTASTHGFAATTSASNTVDVTSLAARTGASGVRITRGSAAGLVYFGTGNSSLPPTLLNSQMWYGIGIRFQTLPSSDTVILRVGAGTGVSGYINVDNTGRLNCQIQGGTASSAVATLTTGVWYWLEILHDVSTTTHTIQARINGGTSQSANRTGQSATTSRFNIIGTDVAGGGTYTCDYDDLVIYSSTTSFQGNHKVVHLRPDSDGNSVWSITGGDGVNRWNSVDDLTPDDATSYISTTTANAVQLFGFPNYTLGDGESFAGISVYGRVGSTGTSGTRTVAANLRSGVTDGTASTWSASINGWQDSNVARDYADVPGGTGWSQSNVDGIVLRLLKDATTSEVRVTHATLSVAVAIPFSVDKSATDSATLSESSSNSVSSTFGSGDPIFLDPFTRADQLLSADDDWDRGLYNPNVDPGTSIVSNAVKNTVDTQFQSDYTVRNDFGDGDYSFKWVTPPPASKSIWFGICFKHITDPGAGPGDVEGYVVLTGTEADGDAWAELYSIKDDTWTFLNGVYNQTAWVSGNGVGIQKNGSSLTVYRYISGSWSSWFTATNSVHSSGRIAIAISDTTTVIDDVFHTSLTSGANLSPADTDSFTFAEASSISITNTSTDSSTLSEARAIATTVASTDSPFTLSEAKTIALDRTDGATFTESSSNSAVLTGTTETFTSSESRALSIDSTRTDSASITDQTISITADPTTSDAVATLFQTFRGISTSGPTDTGTLTDSSAISISGSSDSATGTETSSLSIDATRTDNVTLTDQSALAGDYSRTDSTSLSESSSNNVSTSALDISIVSESYSLDVGQNKADNAALSESPGSLDTSGSINDTSSLAETSDITTDISSIDLFTFNDASLLDITILKNALDSFNFTEGGVLVNQIDSIELITLTEQTTTPEISSSHLDSFTLSEGASEIADEGVTSDDGSLSESPDISVSISSSDSFAFNETGIVSTDNDKNGIDSISFSEIPSINVGFASSDDIDLSESNELNVGYSPTDSSDLLESGEIEIVATGTDQSIFSESSLVEVDIISSDDSSFQENYNLSVNVNVLDGALIAEIPDIASILTISEVLSLIENSSLNLGDEGLPVMIKIAGNFVQVNKKRKVNGIFS